VEKMEAKCRTRVRYIKILSKFVMRPLISLYEFVPT
jgi:hypothetical protein